MKKQYVALALALTFLMAALTGCAGTWAGLGTGTSGPRAGITPYGTPHRISNYEVQVDQGDMSARHLAALIGLSNDDVHTTLGAGSQEGAAMDGARHYHHALYGKQTDFDVRYGNNDRVRQVTVTVDKADALRWRQELNALYGAQAATSGSGYHWQDTAARIDWAEQGDKIRITITSSEL